MTTNVSKSWDIKVDQKFWVLKTVDDQYLMDGISVYFIGNAFTSNVAKFTTREEARRVKKNVLNYYYNLDSVLMKKMKPVQIHIEISEKS